MKTTELQLTEQEILILDEILQEELDNFNYETDYDRQDVFDIIEKIKEKLNFTEINNLKN